MKSLHGHIVFPYQRGGLRTLCLFWFLLSSSLVRGETYYIDSSAGEDTNTGLSPSQAWKTLEKVNGTTFGPGDRILFAAGGRWAGRLHPKGSGAAGSPIVIDQYGSGPLPVIDGEGSTGDSVVMLRNQEYWEINRLEITNDAENGGDRRGVMIIAANCGLLRHIHLKNLYIHHIKGIVGQSIQAKDTGAIAVFIDADDVMASRFDDILIEGCRIETIDNTGIFSRSRAPGSNTPGEWNWNRRRITNLRVRHNKINDIGKNAMIIRLADGGVIEHNVCWDTAYRAGTGNTIFSRSSRGTVFQYNEGYLNRSVGYDGCLYDADLESPGCIFQYSYSHDNSHGLFWMCTEPQDDNVIVRYNISQNDRGSIFCINYPNTSCHIYNNVVFVPPHLSPRIIDERRNADKTYTFTNNIIYNLSPTASYNWYHGKRTISNNVFFGFHPDSEPDDPHKITDDPRFVDAGTGQLGIDTLDGYKLKPDSPCINSGQVMMPAGGHDFWGNPVPAAGTTTDRGAHEFGPGQDTSRADLGTFADMAATWLRKIGMVPFKESKGLVVIEAEHYYASSAAGKHAWETILHNEASGGMFVQALPDIGEVINAGDIESRSARLNYLVDFTTVGTYYFWIKARALSGNGDSIHYGLNGVPVSSGYEDSLEVDKGALFTWRSSTKSVRPVLRVHSAGLHTVDLWMREDGAMVDCLLLSADSGYVPVQPDETTSLPADLNCDGIVNFVDFAEYLQQYLPAAPNT